MHKNFLIAGLQILSLLGLADSLYLSYDELTNTSLTCSIKGLDGCNTVAASVYSHVFGIPLAIYGVVFYALMFLMTFLVAKVAIRFAHDILAFLGIVGLIASIFFVLIQVFLIKALCIYCLGSAVISLLACILAIMLWKRFTAPAKAKIPDVVTNSGL